MPVTKLFTPLVTPIPTPTIVMISDAPNVTGVRASPTMDTTPPAKPTLLPATLEMLAPNFILSSSTAPSSRASRNCLILELLWLNRSMNCWAAPPNR